MLVEEANDPEKRRSLFFQILPAFAPETRRNYLSPHATTISAESRNSVTQPSGSVSGRHHPSYSETRGRADEQKSHSNAGNMSTCLVYIVPRLVVRRAKFHAGNLNVL
jgi:hypothetical protein